jgi:hypothetical protein
MFARSIRMMLLLAILMVVASAVGARACDDMAAMVTSSDRQETLSPEQIVVDIAQAIEVFQVSKLALNDVGGCLPGCCQGSACCHLMPISPLADLSPPRGEKAVTIVTVGGKRRSTQPDVPPPKAI